MQAIKTMLLGLIIMLVGFGFFVILINTNLGSYAGFGPVNVLVDTFLPQNSGSSAFGYLDQVASVIRLEEGIALAVIGAGFLVSIAGYVRGR